MAKLGLIVVLTIMMIVPLIVISVLVEQRESRRKEAVTSIGSSWAHGQEIFGPCLVVPLRTRINDSESRNYHWISSAAVFLPDRLEIEGDLSDEIRSRGIFDVTVYRSALSIRGVFARPELVFERETEILWSQSRLVLGISDPRGIEQASLLWSGTEMDFQPGSQHAKFLTSGIHVAFEDPRLWSEQTEFRVDLQLRGTQTILFAPAGNQTSVNLRSSWPDPSFFGASLPVDKTIGARGFEARWDVSYLARDFPQQWADPCEQPDLLRNQVRKSLFGVELSDAVGPYLKVTRSVKYGVLFVGFTFLVYFLFEATGPLRIHPVQYLSVGAALCTFYLLLLSLSEHVGFDWAYLLASLATVALICAYSWTFLWIRERMLALLGELSSLYTFLFVILQLEDYALLAGSVATFVLLAAFMYFTRKLDWYHLKTNVAK